MEVKLPPAIRRAISCALRSESKHVLVHQFDAISYSPVQLDADDRTIDLGQVHPGKVRELPVTAALYTPPTSPLPVITRPRAKTDDVVVSPPSVGRPEPLERGAGVRAEASIPCG